MPATHLILLRGINVGGKHIVPMKELAALVEQAGGTGVKTYIQSGNVIATVAPKLAPRLPAVIAASIKDRFGFDAPVVVRSRGELERVGDSNPFLAAGKPEDALHVCFLRDEPDPAKVAGLDPDRSPGDLYIVQGKEIYLCLPSGVADSKLTNAYFDSQLATITTARNWRTVGKLLAMMRA